MRDFRSEFYAIHYVVQFWLQIKWHDEMQVRVQVKCLQTVTGPLGQFSVSNTPCTYVYLELALHSWRTEHANYHLLLCPLAKCGASLNANISSVGILSPTQRGRLHKT